MLPNLRVAVAAVLAGLLLIVTAFGLAATVRIAQNAKIGPIERPHALAYAEPDNWGHRQTEPGPVTGALEAPACVTSGEARAIIW